MNFLENMVENKQNDFLSEGKRKIRKITIEDLMSHKHTVLEFADGITLLSGITIVASPLWLWLWKEYAD